MNVEKILRNMLIGGAFLVLLLPFVVLENMFFPFITGKNFIFRILVELMVGGWLVLAYRNVQYRPKKSLLLIATGVFVGIIALADFLGENPFKSIWSNYERMEGLVGLVHLLFYVLITTTVLSTEKLWRRFFQFSISASVVMSIFGLFQLAGFATINQGGVRVDGTFGNAAYLASYMMMHVFIAGWLSLKESLYTWKWWIYAVTITLNLFILYHTQTRGAILGLIGGALLTALLVAFFEKDNKTLRKTATSVILGLVIFVGGFITFKDTSFIRESPTLNRFATISLTEQTTTSRFMVWGMAIEGFKERPILGWGQENFNYVFNKYYNPNMYNQEPWFDRAHNIFFDWLIAGGLLGLLGYLSLFVIAIYFIWKRKRFSVVEKSVLTGLFAAYFFQNLFVFDNLVSYVTFFSLLAYVASFEIRDKEGVTEKVKKTFIKWKHGESSSMDYIVVSVIIVGMLSVGYLVNYKPIASNITLLNALKPQEEGLSVNLEYFESAIAYNTLGRQESREQLSRQVLQIFSAPNVPDDLKNTFANFTVEELRAQIEEAPNDARSWLFLGTFLSSIGQYEDSIIALDRAKELAPKKQTILIAKGASFINLGQYENARDALEEAYILAPAYDVSRELYGLSLMYTREDEKAKELFAEGYELVLASRGDDYDKDNKGYDKDKPHETLGIPVSTQFINIFVARKDYNSVLTLWKALVESDPENLQHRLNLAATYLKVGQRGNAITEIQGLIDQNAEFKDQGEYYINEIRAGRNP